MTAGVSEQQRRYQIERLLGYRGVGPLSPRAIAINLGTALEEIAPLLRSLLEEQRIVELADGRLTVSNGGRPAARAQETASKGRSDEPEKGTQKAR